MAKFGFRLKTIFGILLMLFALAGLFLWETYGREAVLQEEVLVAANDILEGSIVSSSDFATIKFEKGKIIDGYLKPSDVKKLIGQEAVSDIPKKSQLSSSMFAVKKNEIPDGKSIYRIKAQWIDNISSSLRAGDTVEIFNTKGELLGIFELAFVKDKEDKEIVNELTDDTSPSRNKLEILDRKNSNSVLDHIEIIASVEEYFKLYDEVKKVNDINNIKGTYNTDSEACLVIVQVI